MAENVENVHAGGVDNRRPSDVFLALARYRILGEQSELAEFAGLMEAWAQIREMEKAAGADLRPPLDELFDAPDSDTGEDVGTEGDVGELEPRTLDEVEPVSYTYSGYGSSIKNATRDRLIRLRADGLKTSRIMAVAGARLRYGDLLDILEANPVRFSVYETLAAVLDEIEAADAGEAGADG